MLNLNLSALSTATLLEAALHYAEAGVPVFPCGLDKAPLVQGGFKTATTNSSQIREWWRQWPEASIGVPTGNASGVFALDVDMPDGTRHLDQLESKFGRLPKTLTQRTGSGGMHLFFASYEGVEVKNKVRHSGTHLDVRGDGGYVIVPPSGHPAGSNYTWQEEHPVADAPEWLFRWMNQAPPQQGGSPLPMVNSSAYAESAFKAEISAVRQAPNGKRNNTLNKAAFSLGQLVGAGHLDQREVEKALFGASSLPSNEKAKTIRSGLSSGMEQPRDFPTHTSYTDPQIGQNNETDAQSFFFGEIHPIPFDDHSPSPLSPDAIPEPLRSYCVGLSESIQVPIELAFCAALGAVSVAAQRKFKVHINTEYDEPVNIYALCALRPGERKSAVVEKCKVPIKQWEKEMRQGMEAEAESAASELKTLLKAIEVRRTEAAKAKPSKRQELMEEIRQLENELPEVPIPPRLLADDFTPEALASIMADHEQRIGLLEAEGGIFDTLAGRYNRGVSNIDAVLKFWGNESVSVDRKGKETIYLNDPALSLIVCPQPDVVKGLAKKDGFKGRGLLGRILYFIPKSRLGSRIVNAPPMSALAKSKYETMVRTLLDIPWLLDAEGEKTHYLLLLDQEAKERRDHFAETIEKEFLPKGELEFMTDWGGKLPGMAVRIAALLHLTQCPSGNSLVISGPIMAAALDIAALLVEHAKAAFSLMGASTGHECAKAILEWIQKDRMEKFSGRDVLRVLSGRFPTMAEVEPGLDLLTERSYLHPERPESNGPGRKPSMLYYVNPVLLEG